MRLRSSSMASETEIILEAAHESAEPAAISREARALPFSFAKRHGILIREFSDAAADAVYRPGVSPLSIAEAQRFAGVALKLSPVSSEDFDALLQESYEQGSHKAMQMVGGLDDDMDLEQVAQELQEPSDLLESDDDAPIIRFINAVLTEAVKENASDVHIEPYENRLGVRFRVDGVLHEVLQTRRALAPLIVSRIKVMSKLDIAEKRLPQDGRISLRIAGRAVDVRVSTLPSGHGERVVLRLLDKQAGRLDLASLGMDEKSQTTVDELIHKPHGIILVTGPTGSGKTTTLYAALHERRKIRPDTNIITVEDPIEYRLDGVTQVQVNHAIGLGFAQVLRAMLRQDPDVVMVGEVRDEETAQLALEAAMTGHLVFTSIHANNAGAVVQRFENFGCNRTVIAQSLALVLIQRLARRLCPRCTVTGDVPELLRDSLIARELYDPKNPVPFPRAPGCDACDQTGLAGRVAVIESMRVNDEIRSMLMANRLLGDTIALAEQTGALVRFPRYASFMMEQRLIGPAEALLSVAT